MYGSLNGTVSWFQDPNNPYRTSAHYLIGRGGEVVQMVREKDIAHHATIYNQNSIGIEHEDNQKYLTQPWATEEMYQASAKLVRYLTEKYNIPRDRSYIIGHNEVPSSGKQDPGPYWDWNYFMALVRGQTALRIELTWDTDGTDLDAHFIRPGGVIWNIPDDCHFANPNPDWGLPGIAEDNPLLDRDDIDGYGPENITLRRPYEQGSYQYKVHYWCDRGRGPSTATVKIWVNDVKVFEASRLLRNNEVWHCASINWPSGVVTIAIPQAETILPPAGIEKDKSLPKR